MAKPVHIRRIKKVDAQIKGSTNGAERFGIVHGPPPVAPDGPASQPHPGNCELATT